MITWPGFKVKIRSHKGSLHRITTDKTFEKSTQCNMIGLIFEFWSETKQARGKHVHLQPRFIYLQSHELVLLA